MKSDSLGSQEGIRGRRGEAHYVYDPELRRCTTPDGDADMTAEAVIMNKSAVALAADSAVTLAAGSRTPKVFNTSNKIFALSKCAPVGFMVFGNTEFMSVPWETIVKLFRRQLGTEVLPTIAAYAQRFREFLAESDCLRSEGQQLTCLRTVLAWYAGYLSDRIAEAGKAETERRYHSGEDLDRQQVQDVYVRRTWEVIDAEIALWAEAPLRYGLDEDAEARLSTQCGDGLEEFVKAFRSVVNSDQDDVQRLRSLAVRVVTRHRDDIRPPVESGIVIAGYGEDEVFPCVHAFHTLGIVANRLLLRGSKDWPITTETRGAVIPFAQSEMVYTFMEGVDPGYRHRIRQEYEATVKRILEAVVQIDEQRTEEEKRCLQQALTALADGELDRCEERLSEYRWKQQVEPVIGIVSALPKEELAEMAEALVSLTSLKRKMSRDQETVGGPIDVAVISKGDGLVWIKRKHYFRAELNPQFFVNYNREADHERSTDQ